MSHCCGNHSETEKIKRDDFGEKLPKSFIGKFLYNLGKKEYEKELKDGKNKYGCCQRSSS